MREVAVIGVGMTKFCPTDKTQIELFAEASLDAAADANISLQDIQAVWVGNSNSPAEEGQDIIAPLAAADLGLAGRPAMRVEGACSSGSMAVRDAFLWVASGYYDIVLAGGTERQTIMATEVATRLMNMGMHALYESPTGLTFPGVFAMVAHLYASKYGIPLPVLKEAMARVAIKNHKNGARNPKAQFFGKTIGVVAQERRKRLIERGKADPGWQSEMDFLSSEVGNPMVASPLQMFDCCPISDGAAAVILASMEVARKLTDKPVIIAGVGQSSAGSLSSQKDITRVKTREQSVQQAYKMAGVTPEDIDVCELHDCFTIAEIVASEGLGFFEFGQGYKALERGDTDIGGRIPINPSGGLKARGHPVAATGAAQVYEITRQLRGECGDWQVDGARVGLTDTLGGCLASMVHIILKRGW